MNSIKVYNRVLIQFENEENDEDVQTKSKKTKTNYDQVQILMGNGYHNREHHTQMMIEPSILVQLNIKNIKKFNTIIELFRAGEEHEGDFQELLEELKQSKLLYTDNIKELDNPERIWQNKTKSRVFDEDEIKSMEMINKCEKIFKIMYNCLQEARDLIREEAINSILPTEDCSLDDANSCDLEILDEHIEVNPIKSHNYEHSMIQKNDQSPHLFKIFPKFAFTLPLNSKYKFTFT